MALTKSDLEAVAAVVVTILDARDAAAVSAPRKAKASDTFHAGKRDADGNIPGGFACTVTLDKGTAPCMRTLKTVKRAASHEAADGHQYRA